MAEYCFDCITKTFPKADPKRNDMRHSETGQLAYDVCEGYGPGWFDRCGRKVRDIDPKDSNGDGNPAQ